MAQKAFKIGEVPVGAVIIKNDKIIAKAYNKKEKTNNALCHAEIIAINTACKKLKSWRLNDCEMYVTLEPCPMCAGAILSSRIKKLHVATLDDKYGAVISKYKLLDDNNLNHKTEIQLGECKKESEELLNLFFKNLRISKKIKV